MNVVSPANPFEVLWRMGYRRLCPITPPGCPLAPTSSLARRIATNKGDDRGKAPGKLRNDGLWVGMHDFLTYQATESDLDLWRSWGAGVGIVGTGGVCAIDADCRDPAHAEITREEVEKRFGLLPKRVGRAPKALYPCRTAPDFAYDYFNYGEGDRIELIAGGQRQFVVHGIHPGTLRPYEWVRRLLPLDELSYAEPAALADLMEALRGRLPDAREIVRSGGGPTPDQETLRGRLDLVREAVRATPNTTAAFPTRDHYRDYGYAIKASLPDEPAEAFEIFSEWCARWDDGEGENEPDVVESDWRRMRPPFRRGASWLYELAEKASPARFSRAAAWCEELPAEPEPFISIFRDDEPPSQEQPETLRGFPASDLGDALPPPQRWLARDLIPAGTVTMLYGDGATGKSLVALQLCVARVIGGDWLGLPVGQGPAMFLTAEDDHEELNRRLHAILRGTGTFVSDLGALDLIPLVGADAVLAAPNPRTGLLEPTLLYRALRARIERLRPSLLALDTLADLFGGDEIKRIQARQFIRLIIALGQSLDFELTIILLAHPSVAGMNSGTDTSGSTGWSNSVRSRLSLSRRFAKYDDKQVEIDADVRVLSNKKANRSRSGTEMTLRWVEGRFQVEHGADQDEAAKMDELAFLTILDEFERSGRPLGAVLRSSSYAPRMMMTHDQGAKIGQARLESAMTRLFGQSVIEILSYGPPAKNHQKIARKSY